MNNSNFFPVLFFLMLIHVEFLQKSHEIIHKPKSRDFPIGFTSHTSSSVLFISVPHRQTLLLMQQGDFVGANYFRFGQNFSDTALFSLALKYFMNLFRMGHQLRQLPVHLFVLPGLHYPSACHMLQNTEERVHV